MATPLHSQAHVADPQFTNPSVPPTIRKEVSDFAKKSESLANQILREASNENDRLVIYDGPVVIHHYYTPWTHYFYSPFWYPQPVIYRRDRNSRDEGLRMIAGLVFTVLGAIAMISAGSAFSRYRDAKKELAGADDLRRELTVYLDMNSAPNVGYVEEAKRLINLKTKVCKRVKNSALADLILRIGVAAASIIAIAGAVALLPGYFMSIGTVAVAAFAAAMLFKLAMESNQQDIDDAKAMHQSIAKLDV